MKGKYAKRATLNRDFAGTEQRAIAAENERDRLAADLAEARDRYDRETSALRAELAAARSQRDQAAAPLLDAAQGRINDLTAKLEAQSASQAKIQRTQDKLISVMHAWLMETTGRTGTEALEMVGYLIHGEQSTLYGGSDGIPDQLRTVPDDQELIGRIRAIQQARGHRRKGRWYEPEAPAGGTHEDHA